MHLHIGRIAFIDSALDRLEEAFDRVQVRRVLRVEHQERLHVEDGLADSWVTMDGGIVHE